MSLIFDNVDDYAISTTPPVTAAPLTICAWVKPTSTGAQDYIIYLGDTALTGTTQCFALRMESSGQITAYVADTAGSSNTTANTTGTMSTSAWNHVAMIVTSSSDRTAVLNGNWAQRASPAGTRTPTGVTDFVVGMFPRNFTDPNNEWGGHIGHVAVWNVALSQPEIETLAAGATPTEIQAGNLIAYWPFTNAGAAGEDVIGTNDLTLNGNAAYDADNPTLGTRKLKLLAHSSAASATNIAGTVFAAPSGSDITGAKIGEFTNKTFEASLESGQAVLKVPVADFGGAALTLVDTPVALARNTTNTTGIVACTVIEE